MATESPPVGGGGPQVFARNATGLRREARARDVFIYNTNNQNVGIGVTFMVLLIPAFYAGGSMLVATLLAGLLALPMACVYAYFAAAMPRSGGDYVYIGRTLHPFLGFLASWNWVIWLITYTGIPAAYLAQYGLSGLFRELGYVFDSPTLVGYGDDFTRKWWIFVAGTILLIFFAIVFSIGTRLYFRIQNVDVRHRDARRGRRPRRAGGQGPRRHPHLVQRLHLGHRRVGRRRQGHEQVLGQPAAGELRPQADVLRDGLAAVHHPVRDHLELPRRRGAQRPAQPVPGHARLDRLRHDPDDPPDHGPRPRRGHRVPGAARRRDRRRTSASPGRRPTTS